MELIVQIKKKKNLSDTINNKAVKYFFLLSQEGLTREIKNKTPVKYGKLRGSWTPKLSKDKLVVSNTRNYAVFVEKGTGMFSENPHMITPKNADVFHAEINGEDVFFRSHKGMEGRHMAKKGAEEFKKKIPQIWRTAFIRAVQE